MDLIIDEELRDWLPVPSIGADVLEQQLLAAGGPSDPIRVWKGTGIVVDGHRRLAICQKHGLPYRIEEMEFDSRQAVKDWMDSYQLARRNLDSVTFSRVLTRLVNSRVGAMEPDGGGVEKAMGEVGAEVGVSVRTIQRSRAMADAIAKLPPAIGSRIQSGEIKANRTSVMALAKMTPEFQAKAIRRLDMEGHTSLSAVVGKAAAAPPPSSEGDSVSPPPKPETPAAPKKSTRSDWMPTLDEIKEAEKRLGRAWRAVDEMFETAKTSRYYTRLSTALRSATEILTELHRGAE